MTVGEFDHLFRTAGPSRSVLREPWMDEALCAQTDPDAFFPESGASSRAAKALCAECPVRVACLGYALANNLQDGIYAGLSPKERARLRRSAA